MKTLTDFYKEKDLDESVQELIKTGDTRIKFVFLSWELAPEVIDHEGLGETKLTVSFRAY